MAYDQAFAAFGHSGDYLTQKRVPAGCCLVMAAECGVSTGIVEHVGSLYQLFSSSDPVLAGWIKNPTIHKASIERRVGFNIRIYTEGQLAPNFALHLFMAHDYHDGLASIFKSGVYKYPCPNENFTINLNAYSSNLARDMIEDAYNGSLYPTQSQAVSQMTTNPIRYSDFYWNIADKYPYNFDSAMAQGGWFGGTTVFYNFSCRAPIVERRMPPRALERSIVARRADSAAMQNASAFAAPPASSLRARIRPAGPAPSLHRRQENIATLQRDYPDLNIDTIENIVNRTYSESYASTNRSQAPAPFRVCNQVTGFCRDIAMGAVDLARPIVDPIVNQIRRLRYKVIGRGGRRTRRCQNKKNKTRSNKHKRSTKTRRC